MIQAQCGQSRSAGHGGFEQENTGTHGFVVLTLLSIDLLGWGLLAVLPDEGESDPALVEVQDVLNAIAVIHIQVSVTDTYSPLRLYLVVDEAGDLVVDISASAAGVAAYKDCDFR